MKKQVFVLIAIIIFTCSCTNMKIINSKGGFPATYPLKIKAKVYFWGLKRPVLDSLPCQGNGLYMVEVKRNLGQNLVSAITLGIVSPITITIQCQKDNRPPQ